MNICLDVTEPHGTPCTSNPLSLFIHSSTDLDEVSVTRMKLFAVIPEATLENVQKCPETSSYIIINDDCATDKVSEASLRSLTLDCKSTYSTITKNNSARDKAPFRVTHLVVLKV